MRRSVLPLLLACCLVLGLQLIPSRAAPQQKPRHTGTVGPATRVDVEAQRAKQALADQVMRGQRPPAVPFATGGAPQPATHREVTSRPLDGATQAAALARIQAKRAAAPAATAPGAPSFPTGLERKPDPVRTIRPPTDEERAGDQARAATKVALARTSQRRAQLPSLLKIAPPAIGGPAGTPALSDAQRAKLEALRATPSGPATTPRESR